MSPNHIQDGHRTVERAYELAESGRYVDVPAIIRRLRDEGYATPLTDLRGRNLRYDLQRACAASRVHN